MRMMGLLRVFMILLCALTLTIGLADAAKKKKCNKLCKSDIKACRTDCSDLKGKAKRKCKKACKKDSLAACFANPDPKDCVPPTTTTTTTFTTTTTLPPYGSASRAFLDRVPSLLD
jgi:hypothetical protein